MQLGLATTLPRPHHRQYLFLPDIAERNALSALSIPKSHLPVHGFHHTALPQQPAQDACAQKTAACIHSMLKELFRKNEWGGRYCTRNGQQTSFGQEPSPLLVAARLNQPSSIKMNSCVIAWKSILNIPDTNQSIWCFPVHWETMLRVVDCSKDYTYILICLSELWFDQSFSQKGTS